MSDLKVGDRVAFLRAPDWLLVDLPAEEQEDVLSYVGQVTEITQVDKLGYYWIGFGSQADTEEGSSYSGHSFALTADCLRKQL